MITTTANRIVELWPALTDEQRACLVAIAEDAAMGAGPLRLTPDEAAALRRSKEDFEAGRALSFAEVEAATDEFLRDLRGKACAP